MTSHDGRRHSFLTAGTALLLLLVCLGAVAAVYRMSSGLGASTNLSDDFPWGLWKHMNVLVGIALSAGGFTIAAAVYVLNLRAWKPLARPAVLIAFAGYLSASVSLLFDIGKPAVFWHPIVMWQPHSILFEVIWCLLLYTIVLLCEFSPVLLEGMGLERLARTMRAKAVMIPLVVMAATLSFLHQSSLGGLFLLMKGTLGNLWWTTMLPYNFFLSAVAVALATTSLEILASSRLFGHAANLKLLPGLAKGTAAALGLHAALRLGDLLLKGHLGLALAGDQAGMLFLAEVGLGVLLPMLLLVALSRSENGVMIAQLLVIAGMVLNRFSILYFVQNQPGATSYMPSWVELALTVGMFAAVLLAYRAAVLCLPVMKPAASS